MSIIETRRKFSGYEFLQMAQSGIIGKEDRVELLGGEIISMSPVGPDHSAIVARLTEILSHALYKQALLFVQNSIQLDPISLPEPDLTVTRWRPDYYKSALPTPADVLLIVEVAQTSFEYDRSVKLPKYAAAAIPEVWLINVEADQVERYTRPEQDHYRSRLVLSRGDTISTDGIPNLQVAVNDILG